MRDASPFDRTRSLPLLWANAGKRNANCFSSYICIVFCLSLALITRASCECRWLSRGLIDVQENYVAYMLDDIARQYGTPPSAEAGTTEGSVPGAYVRPSQTEDSQEKLSSMLEAHNASIRRSMMVRCHRSLPPLQ